MSYIDIPKIYVSTMNKQRNAGHRAQRYKDLLKVKLQKRPRNALFFCFAAVHETLNVSADKTVPKTMSTKATKRSTFSMIVIVI